MRYFLIGAVGYPCLELLWRGRTHISMALAGGLSAMLMHRIGHLRGSLLRRSAISAMGITAIEAVCGLIWNRRHQVWDYRRMPLNWRGQICLPFSLAWGLLSAAFIQLDKACRKA